MINPSEPDYQNTPVSKERKVFNASLDAKADKPVISIITPFYNTTDVFYETAQAVFQQSLQQWEWIIINDGSTDQRALEILDEYRAIDPRVRVVDHDLNAGLSASRNTGFKEATTEFVLQLDSDDLIEPTVAEKWYWFLLTHPEYGFVKGYTVGFGAQEYLWTHGFHDKDLFLTENPADATSMIRKSVHAIVGGYESANQGGLEDWDFWLHCAAHGFWGSTIPEYQDWYRIRPKHRERWENWNQKRIENFLQQSRQRYPTLWSKGFPEIELLDSLSINIETDMDAGNQLVKKYPRMLMILPWMRVGGADKFNLDLLEQLTQRGWEVSIITTLSGDHSWLPEFEKFTSDIFILDHFLRPKDFPGFIKYFIESRSFDTALISNSMLGYQLLPFLRYHFPDLTIVDICHMEEESGQFGAYPAVSVQYQDFLNLHIVSTEHLRQALINHGVPPSRVMTCTTNVDEKELSPDLQEREKIREELGISQDQCLILYAARLCKQKQPGVLADTCLILRGRGLDFKCFVIGDGPDRLWLEQYIQRNQLTNHVTLLGSQSHQRLKQIMNASDIFFLPSEWEGIALTMYTALSLGVPAVGADVGGQSELVTPDCGLLIQRGEHEAERYADILSDLIADPERRHSMGESGRLRITRFYTLDQMGKCILRLLALAKTNIFEQVVLSRDEAIQTGLLAASYAEEHTSWVEPASQTPLPVSQQENETNYLRVAEQRWLYKAIKRVSRPFYLLILRLGFNHIVQVKNQFKKLFVKRSVLDGVRVENLNLVEYTAWLEQQRANWQAAAEEFQRGNKQLEGQRSYLEQKVKLLSDELERVKKQKR